jgi:demethylsterigmatocystin 6-O-methyltransferase
MDPTVTDLLSQVDQLGKQLANTQDDLDSSTDVQRKLFVTSQRLCIALQTPGQIVDQFLFGVSNELSIARATPLIDCVVGGHTWHT